VIRGYGGAPSTYERGASGHVTRVLGVQTPLLATVCEHLPTLRTGVLTSANRREHALWIATKDAQCETRANPFAASYGKSE
jgi:hypothetical protein